MFKNKLKVNNNNKNTTTKRYCGDLVEISPYKAYNNNTINNMFYL